MSTDETPFTPFTPFTPRAKKILVTAREYAREIGHNYTGTEHILIGMLEMEDGPHFQFLEQCGIAPSDLKHKIKALITPADVPKDSLHKITDEVIQILRRAAMDIEVVMKRK